MVEIRKHFTFREMGEAHQEQDESASMKMIA